MECISESTLFALFGSQSLDWLQIEVIIEMQVIEILSVNQQVEHVIPLSADLESCFDPVKFCQLEELCGLEGLEQISLVLRLWSAVMQRVENPALEQFLVGNSDLDWISLWAVLFEPGRDKGDVTASARAACALIEGLRGPEQANSIGGVLGVERLF